MAQHPSRRSGEGRSQLVGRTPRRPGRRLGRGPSVEHTRSLYEVEHAVVEAGVEGVTQAGESWAEHAGRRGVGREHRRPGRRPASRLSRSSTQRNIY